MRNKFGYHAEAMKRHHKKNAPAIPHVSAAPVPTAPTSVSLSMQSRADLMAAASLVLMVFVAFARGLGGEFVIDDVGLIANNPYLRSGVSLADIFSNGFWVFSETPNPVAPMYRPLITLFNLVGFRLWGASPLPFHVAVLLLHAANAVLVFMFLRTMVSTQAALIAAAIFAVSPVRVESVTWISGVPDAVVLFFGLLALFAHRASVARGRRWLVVPALLCFEMALWSKEVAVAFPLIILAHDAFLTRHGIRWRNFAAFALLTLLHLSVRAAVLGTGGDLDRVTGPSADRVLDFVIGYAGLLTLPIHVPFFLTTPNVSVASLSGWMGLLAIVGLYAHLWRTHPDGDRGPIRFSVAWLLIFMWPAAAVALVEGGYFTARLLYLPAVGFALALALAYHASFRRFRVLSVAAGLLVAGYAWLTVVEQRHWLDNERAYLKLTHDDSAAANSFAALGSHYFERGAYGKAEAAYQKALDLRPASNVVTSSALTGLGTIKGMAGNLDQSHDLLQRAIDLNPDSTIAWTSFGNVAWLQNRHGVAADAYRRALTIQSSNAEARTNLNAVMRLQGQSPGR